MNNDHGSRKPLNHAAPVLQPEMRKSISHEAKADRFHRFGTPLTNQGSFHGMRSALKPPMSYAQTPALMLKGMGIPPQLARPKVPGMDAQQEQLQGQPPGAPPPGMPPGAGAAPPPPGQPPPDQMGLTPSGGEVYNDPYHPAHQDFNPQDHAAAAGQQEQAGNPMAAQAHQQLANDSMSPMDRANAQMGGAMPPQPGMPGPVMGGQTPMPGMPGSPPPGMPPQPGMQPTVPPPQGMPPQGMPPAPQMAPQVPPPQGMPPQVPPPQMGQPESPDQNKPLPPPAPGPRQGPVPGMEMAAPSITAPPTMAGAGGNAGAPQPIVPGPSAPSTNAGFQGTPVQPSQGPQAGGPGDGEGGNGGFHPVDFGEDEDDDDGDGDPEDSDGEDSDGDGSDQDISADEDTDNSEDETENYNKGMSVNNLFDIMKGNLPKGSRVKLGPTTITTPKEGGGTHTKVSPITVRTPQPKRSSTQYVGGRDTKIPHMTSSKLPDMEETDYGWGKKPSSKYAQNKPTRKALPQLRNQSAPLAPMKPYGKPAAMPAPSAASGNTSRPALRNQSASLAPSKGPVPKVAQATKIPAMTETNLNKPKPQVAQNKPMRMKPLAVTSKNNPASLKAGLARATPTRKSIPGIAGLFDLMD